MQKITAACVQTFLGVIVLCLCPVIVNAEGVAAADSASGYKVIAYYLYVMPRCQTCLNIEAYSKEVVETAFAKELEQGTIEWHAYDTGMPEYEHLWYDYELETKSLVIAAFHDGQQMRWKNCEKVWELVDDKVAFQAYVRDEIQDYLPSDSTAGELSTP